MEECGYAQEHTRKAKWLGQDVIECKLDPCPYGHKKTLTYDAKDQKITICETDGKITNQEKENALIIKPNFEKLKENTQKIIDITKKLAEK